MSASCCNAVVTGNNRQPLLLYARCISSPRNDARSQPTPLLIEPGLHATALSLAAPRYCAAPAKDPFRALQARCRFHEAASPLILRRDVHGTLPGRVRPNGDASGFPGVRPVR